MKKHIFFLLFLSFFKNQDFYAAVRAEGKQSKTALHEAVKHRDLKKVKAYISAHPDQINATDEHQRTALHIACQIGCKKIVTFLLEKDAHVNMRDCVGNTPLHSVITSGNADIVDCLLKKHANINARGALGLTPLYLACLYGKINIVGLLLKNNADRKIVIIAGQIPLHAACEEGYFDIVTLLATQDTVTTQDAQGATPFDLAHQYGYQDICAFLKKFIVEPPVILKKFDTPQLTSSSLSTPHQLDSQKGNSLKESLDSDAKSNTTSSNSTSSSSTLHATAQLTAVFNSKDQTKIKEFTTNMPANINVNVTLNNGDTPLHILAQLGLTKAARQFISKYRPNVDAQNTDQNTPLHLAAANGHFAIVKMLVENKANVNAQNKKGPTPLCKVCSRESPTLEIINYLLAKGAIITPACCSVVNTPAKSHVLAKLFKAIENKIAEFDVHARNENGDTLLHIAAECEHPGAVTVLIDSKADVNAENTKGQTPLFKACSREELSEEIVDLLLANGAKPNPACWNIATHYQSKNLFDKFQKAVGSSQPALKPNTHIDEKPACPICYEDFKSDTQVSVPACKHIVCTTCTNAMITSAHTQCPLCRGSLQNLTTTTYAQAIALTKPETTQTAVTSTTTTSGLVYQMPDGTIIAGGSNPTRGNPGTTSSLSSSDKKN